MTSKARAGTLRSTALTTTLLTCLALSAHADDIDVYTAQIAAKQKPNILFVLDYSGSMNDNINGGRASRANPAKIDILKRAMRQVLDENFDRINAGIGSLYSTSTTGVRWPISELNADANSIDPDIPAGQFTVRDILQKQVDARSAGGWTATVDALVEAAQYFQGGAVTHNDRQLSPAASHAPERWSVTANNYSNGSPFAALSPSYSPSDAYSNDRSSTFYCNDYSGAGGPNDCTGKIISNCFARTKDDTTTAGYDRQVNLWGNYQRCEYQRNSDWLGARYNSPITQICQANTIVLISDGEPTRINDGKSLKSVIGTNLSGCEDLSSSIFNTGANQEVDGNCGPEVLRALSSRDQNPSIPGSHVNTYSVGFNIKGNGKDYLSLLAEAGQGSFFEANKPEELTAALSTIVDEVLSGSENFSELSIDVDKASFSHDNRAFFSLFSPSVRRSWNGNLKGYFVEPSGLTDIHGNIATTATDAGLQFTEEAQSFWSSSSDGNNVSEGGASEHLLAGSRKLYTYTGNTIPPAGVALAGSAVTRLRKQNNHISSAMLNVSNNAQKNALLDWIQTAPMGDPLHSKSVSINYDNRRVVFVMTNQGLLHAIDATTPTDPSASDTSGGEELYAFMPKQLLANLPALQKNQNSGNHIYGLDGKITRWHDDANNDGIVNNGERALLIVGMRRGGGAYYALDVSNINAPRLKWKIDNTNTDFAELSQSWSRMSLVTVNDNGTGRRVLAFTAGYDASIQDTAKTPTASSGNAIYMVDANGSLLWKVSAADHADMKYSIPSDLTVIDSDGDNLADRLYVGDLGGQVWRVDFEDINTKPSVYLLASLDDGQHQPIFYPPSVALNKGRNGKFFSISLGTGNRTDPLLKGSSNRLYMLRDTDIEKGAPIGGFSTIAYADLFDATDNSVGSSNTANAKTAQEDLDASRGWQIALGPNEKSLSSLVTFEGKVLATTFEAASTITPGSCGFETTGRFYMVDVKDAQPADSLSSNENSQSEEEEPARWRKIKSSGIPSSPVIVFPKGSGVVQVIVDKETVRLIDQQLALIYWHAK